MQDRRGYNNIYQLYYTFGTQNNNPKVGSVSARNPGRAAELLKEELANELKEVRELPRLKSMRTLEIPEMSQFRLLKTRLTKLPEEPEERVLLSGL